MANRRSELTAIIGAKTSGFRRKVGKLGRFTKQIATGISKAFAGIGVGVAGAAAAVGKLINDTDNYVTKLRQQSAATGLAIKQQQKLNHVADQFQVEQEALNDAVKEFSMRMTEQAAGGAQIAAEAVKMLNTDAKTLADLMNKDVGQAMAFVSKRMQGLSRGEKGVVMDQLFGGQAAEKVRKLIVNNADAISRVSDEATKLTTVTEKSAGSVRDFQQAWDKVQQTLIGIRNKVIPPLMDILAPALDDLSEKLVKMRKEGKFMSGLEVAARTVNAMLTRFRKIGAVLDYGADLLTKDWKGTFEVINTYVKSIAKRLQVAIKEAMPGGEKIAEQWRTQADALAQTARIKAEIIAKENDIKSIGERMTNIEKDKENIAKKITEYKREANKNEKKNTEEQKKQNKELQRKIKNLKTAKEIMGEEAPLAFGTPEQQVSALTKGATGEGKEKTTDSLKGQFAEAATLTSKAGFRTGIRRAGERQLASIKTNTGKSARYLKNIQDNQAKTYEMN